MKQRILSALLLSVFFLFLFYRRFSKGEISTFSTVFM